MRACVRGLPDLTASGWDGGRLGGLAVCWAAGLQAREMRARGPQPKLTHSHSGRGPTLSLQHTVTGTGHGARGRQRREGLRRGLIECISRPIANLGCCLLRVLTQSIIARLEPDICAIGDHPLSFRSRFLAVRLVCLLPLYNLLDSHHSFSPNPNPPPLFLSSFFATTPSHSFLPAPSSCSNNVGSCRHCLCCGQTLTHSLSATLP